ncbi:hypothetical protein S1361_20810 [Streptomyces cyanogenus]|uniref:Uncharacterized protein n=1 Tax=Streptomyces cyanogenus TaxID=80860 RepID=A0ABX7TSS1_STRCY|nr:hypothetical protein S1361_20810 [Streptomyces cyanogenus]
MPGTVLLLAASPLGRGRLVDAAGVLPVLAAVAPSVLSGADTANVVELADPLEPQAVLTRLRAAAASPGPLTVYVVGQLHLDRRQQQPHLALARTTPATLRYTALPWHWIREELRLRSATDTALFVDLHADAEAWRHITERGLDSGRNTAVYGRIAPATGRRGLAEPAYMKTVATLLRSGHRPPLGVLHEQAVGRIPEEARGNLLLADPGGYVPGGPVVGLAGGFAPVAGMNGVAPGAGMNGSVPGAGANGVAPGAGMNGAVPGAGMNGAVPGAGMNGAVPGAGMNGAVPGAGANGSVPVAGTSGVAPGAGAGGFVPGPAAGSPAPIAAYGGRAPGAEAGALVQQAVAEAFAPGTPHGGTPTEFASSEPPPGARAGFGAQVPLSGGFVSEPVTAAERIPAGSPSGPRTGGAEAADGSPVTTSGGAVFGVDGEGIRSSGPDPEPSSGRTGNATLTPRAAEATPAPRTGETTSTPRTAETPLGDPHAGISAAVQEGRHGDAEEIAARFEAEAVRVYGVASEQALHWSEVRADLAMLAGDAVRSCRTWLAVAETRLGAGQAGDAPAVEAAVDRAHHQWTRIDDTARARELGPALAELRLRVPGRRRGALENVQRQLRRLQAAR